MDEVAEELTDPGYQFWKYASNRVRLIDQSEKKNLWAKFPCERVNNNLLFKFLDQIFKIDHW